MSLGLNFFPFKSRAEVYIFPATESEKNAVTNNITTDNNACHNDIEPEITLTAPMVGLVRGI